MSEIVLLLSESIYQLQVLLFPSCSFLVHSTKRSTEDIDAFWRLFTCEELKCVLCAVMSIAYARIVLPFVEIVRRLYCSLNTKSLFFSRQLFHFCPITINSNSYPYAFYASNLFYCINERITFSLNTNKKFNRIPYCLVNLIKIVVSDFITCSTFVLRKIGVTSSEFFIN